MSTVRGGRSNDRVPAAAPTTGAGGVMAEPTDATQIPSERPSDDRGPHPAPAPAAEVPALPRPPRGFVVISTERIERIWLVVLVLVVAYAFYQIVDIFLVPIVVAAVFASLAYPMHREWLRITRGRAGIAALLSTLAVIVLAIIPIYLVAVLIANEAASLFQGAESGLVTFIDRASRWIEQVVRGGEASPLGRLPGFGWLRDLPLDQVDWGARIQSLLAGAGGLAATVINRTGTSALQLVLNLIIALFTMFYFFRDGDRIVQQVMYLSPLDKRYERMFVDRLISVARATLRGSFIVGLVQGSLGSLTLWAVGAPAPVLWGVVMVFLALFPMLGTWLILYPHAIVLYSQGKILEGTIVVFMTAVVITNLDNLIRPRLVGRRARMHDLLVFFSTLGGIAVYGMFGFIVGPIIAALLMALLEIYALEFKHQLDFSHAQDEAGAPAAASAATDDLTAPPPPTPSSA